MISDKNTAADATDDRRQFMSVKLRGEWKPSEIGDAALVFVFGGHGPNLDIAYRVVRNCLNTRLALPMYI